MQIGYILHNSRDPIHLDFCVNGTGLNCAQLSLAALFLFFFTEIKTQTQDDKLGSGDESIKGRCFVKRASSGNPRILISAINLLCVLRQVLSPFWTSLL